MSEEDRLDIIEAPDEEGNTLFLQVDKYFYYNGDEYVLLREVEDAQGAPGIDERLHIMRVDISKDDDGEEVEDFVPVEDALAQSLLVSVGERHSTPEDLQSPNE